MAVISNPNVADKFVNTLNGNNLPSIEGTAAPTSGGIIANEFGQNPNGDGHFVVYELPLFVRS